MVLGVVCGLTSKCGVIGACSGIMKNHLSILARF